MLSQRKKKGFLFFSLILLVISLFVPWFNIFGEEATLIKDSYGITRSLIIEKLNPVLNFWKYETNIWVLISNTLFYSIIPLTLLIPIFALITFIQVTRNKSIKVWSNITAFISFTVILTDLNYIYVLMENFGILIDIRAGVILAIIASVLVVISSSLLSEKRRNAKTCPNCHHHIGKGERFCSNCSFNISAASGTEDQASYIFCPTCGKQEEFGTKYCTGCGFELAKHVSDSTSKVKLKEVGKKVGWIKGILLLVMAFLTISLGYLIVSGSSNSPTGVVEKFIKYSETLEYELGEELISRNSDYLTSEIKSKMEQIVTDEYGRGYLDGYKILNEEINEMTAIITVNFSFNHFSSSIIWEFYVEWENATWKISEINME